jgi:hypothetical protein
VACKKNNPATFFLSFSLPLPSLALSLVLKMAARKRKCDEEGVPQLPKESTSAMNIDLLLNVMQQLIDGNRRTSPTIDVALPLQLPPQIAAFLTRKCELVDTEAKRKAASISMLSKIRTLMAEPGRKRLNFLLPRDHVLHDDVTTELKKHFTHDCWWGDIDATIECSARRGGYKFRDIEEVTDVVIPSDTVGMIEEGVKGDEEYDEHAGVLCAESDWDNVIKGIDWEEYVDGHAPRIEDFDSGGWVSCQIPFPVYYICCWAEKSMEEKGDEVAK